MKVCKTFDGTKDLLRHFQPYCNATAKRRSVGLTHQLQSLLLGWRLPSQVIPNITIDHVRRYQVSLSKILAGIISSELEDIFVFARSPDFDFPCESLMGEHKAGINDRRK